MLSEAAHESGYGTAPHTLGWVAVEQPGPWGRDAVRESHLDPQLGAALAESVQAVGWRFALIRHPGTHPDDHRRRPLRLLVASCVPGREWLLNGCFSDPATLRGLNLAALGRSDRAGVAASLPGLAVDSTSHLLVCTNGRRDVCCAVRGRPVAVGVAAAGAGPVWETSHTGGHRFAPTGVLVPSGTVLGRLTVSTATAALSAAQFGDWHVALTGPAHDRGRCGLVPAAQAAESAVRHLLGERRLNALRVSEESKPRVSSAPGNSSHWRVEHRDGRQWTVAVSRQAGGPDRPASCSKPAEPQTSYVAELEPADVQ